jgi:hypothetical protein
VGCWRQDRFGSLLAALDGLYVECLHTRKHRKSSVTAGHDTYAAADCLLRVRTFCCLLTCVDTVFLLGLWVGVALRQAGSASSKRCPSRFVSPLLSLGRLSGVVPCHEEAPVF